MVVLCLEDNRHYSPGLLLSAVPGKMWREPKSVSSNVGSRWADLFDSDSDSDDYDTKTRSNSGQEETSDQPQHNNTSVSVEMGIGVNMNDTHGSQVWNPTPGYTSPLEPNNANIEIGLSVGSLLHDQGTCRPCVFARTRMGCHNGSDCHFCHFTHFRKAAARPCKARRRRFRQRLEEVMLWMEKEAEWLFNDPDWLSLVCARMPQFLQDEPDMKHKVEKQLLVHASKVRSMGSI